MMTLARGEVCASERASISIALFEGGFSRV
jgi:hypothetical protein